MRCFARGAIGLVLAFVFFFAAGSAEGVIKRLTPLREVLASEQLIFTVKVEKIDPDKPSVVFLVEDDLKGKASFRKLPVNLSGDSEGQREQHTAKLLKRLAPDLSLVFFASKRGKRYTAFGYTNGTWFQLIGQIEDDSEAIRWSLTHCEPYLRRTFKGTTAELTDIVKDGLAGKKEPPAPNSKEEPGLGPEVKTEDKPAKQAGISVSGGPTFAVIPTFVILGPLALFASLFGFGGLALFLRRWMVLLSVACLLSTLLLLRGWFRESLHDSWWGSPQALWVTFGSCTLAGILWSWLRYRTAARLGKAEEMQAQPIDQVILRWLSLAGVGVFLFAWGRGSLTLSPWRELLLSSVMIWFGTLYVFILRWSAGRPLATQAPAPEKVMLGVGAAIFVGLSVLTGLSAFNNRSGNREVGEFDSDVAPGGFGETPMRTGENCSFKATTPGTFDSSPLVRGNRIYIGAALRAGFISTGVVYCLEHSNGKLREIWHFDNEGDMKQVFSSPCFGDGGCIYVGEGYHQDSDCKLYCLQAGSGKKLWAFQTKSHTESSPLVAGGRVYFGAGEDGVYCLDATTGKEIWHHTGVHVDTSPAVEENRLYAGSGYGDHFEFFCLNAVTGKPLWQTPSPLPVFGSPTVLGDQVFFGIGNGNFLESDSSPAGAVVSLHTDTGKVRWSFKTPDGVHGRPAADRRHVYFGCRDHNLYAVGRHDGHLRWQRDLGSPIVASPALLTCADCGDSTGLYAVASGGLVACLDPADGKTFWDLSIAGETLMKTQLLSSPRLAIHCEGNKEFHSIYFGSGLDNSVEWTARLFSLEDAEKLPIRDISGPTHEKP
jgi:outer membrane protein assembly factor BamB